MSIIFILFSKGPNFASYKRIGRASVLKTFIPENFWTKVGWKELFWIPSISANFDNFCWISF